MSSPRRVLLPFLLLLTLAVYARVIACDFTNWDDPGTVAKDPGINPPTWAGLVHHWTHADMDIYMPVTQTVWAVTAIVAKLQQPDLYGIRLNPYLFHILNLLAHLLSVAAVFSLLRLLLPDTPAFFGAAFFAVHPVMVEPIAWVSGLKDVLCGAFSLIALRLWIAPITANDFPRRRFITAGAFFVLALLSKPSAVSLPLIAGILAITAFHWHIQRTVRRLLPWIFLTLPILIIAHHSQPAPNVPSLSFIDRSRVAVDAIYFYLGKIVWPIHLGIDYGRTPQLVLSQEVARSIAIALTLLVCGGLLLYHRRRYPLLAAGALIFVAALTPVLGLIAFDFQEKSTVADHYLYVAMLGPALIVAALINQISSRLAYFCCAIIVALLGLGSFLQIGYWSDSITLMSHALRINPNSWVAHINLAEAQMPTAPQLAADEARIACQLRPNAADGFQNLGAAETALGQSQNAANAFRRWVAIAPKDARAWSNLAGALRSCNQRDQSIAAYHHSLNLDPTRANYCADLAGELAETGQLSEAIDLYNRALRIDPNLSVAQQGLAMASRQLQLKNKH